MQTKKRRLKQVFETILAKGLGEYGFTPRPEVITDLAQRLADATAPEKAPSAQAAMFGAVSFITKLSPELNKGQIAKFAADLIKMGVTPKQLVALYWINGLDPEALRHYEVNPNGKPSPWCADWRSRKTKEAPLGTKSPNERDIRATIGEFLEVAESTPAQPQQVEEVFD